MLDQAVAGLTPSPFRSPGLASELGPCVGAFLIHGSLELLPEIKPLTMSLPRLPLMSEFQFYKAQVSSYGTPDIQKVLSIERSEIINDINFIGIVQIIEFFQLLLFSILQSPPSLETQFKCSIPSFQNVFIGTTIMHLFKTIVEKVFL
ncbi:hypothetical protein MJT46_005465 [Ovis ammon polii x Ovis aries]|nr:hypothetical protein MJT46_005465 [Ovis ammon polii x Ovis aries]